MNTVEQQRQQRAAALAAAQQDATRRGRTTRLAAVVAALAVVAGAVVALTVAGADDDGARTPTSQLSASSAWAPRYDQMPETLQRLNFPPVGDESYHAHALLSVYVNGSQVPVPADIGIDQAGQIMSPVHTHDTTGVVHLEADDPYPFTLEQVFQIWGQPLENGRLGPEQTRPGEQVFVYVNGQPAQPEVQIADRDNIVVALGTPGSFPTQPDDSALDAH